MTTARAHRDPLPGFGLSLGVTLAWLSLIVLVPLSALALGERVSRRQWVAAAVGLLGVLALMAPWAAPGPGDGAP